MDLIEKAANKLADLDKEKGLENEQPVKPRSKKTEAASRPDNNRESMIEKMVSMEPDDSESLADTPNACQTESDHSQLNNSLSGPVPSKDAPVIRPDQNEATSMELNIELLREQGMVTPDSSRSRIKEEYRQIKRPLLMNASGKGNLKSERSNMIMVTSSRANEGKTFSAINLAMSIAAERDKTVLLVDCDVIQPSVAEFYRLENTKGLTDYLNDKASINEIIVRTNLPTFRIISAGQPHHLANELLASEKMEQLMDELSTRYSDRIVILDSPPLLSTTEAAILSGHVGQILVVVEADNTKQDELEEALSKLPVSNEVAIGVVLNKSQRHMDGSYYSYGSSYGGS